MYIFGRVLSKLVTYLGHTILFVNPINPINIIKVKVYVFDSFLLNYTKTA